MDAASRPTTEDLAAATERLESWKEIAAYLRRGVRTIRRWEKEEGLPIHRQLHKKLGTVYAYRGELDAWRNSRRPRGDAGVRAAFPPRAVPERAIIAVLPFENLSGDAEQEYVADGLTEEMICHLGQYDPESLGVIARTTVMQYKGSTSTVRQIGAALNVDYALEGSIRRDGDRIRVTAQLIRVSDQAHLWSRSYEQAMHSILALQRELAADIGRDIRFKLSPLVEKSSSDAQLVNPDAYEWYLKGRHFLNEFTPESVRRSVGCFRHAIDLDPTYAPPHAALAEAQAWLPIWLDTPPAETLPAALESAERALALDFHHPTAHVALGLVHAYYLWAWSKAEAYFRRAIELNPAYSPARQWYAEFLAELGRTDEALAVLEVARAHDPLSRSVQATRAFVFWLGRRFDDAIAEARRVLETDPTHAMALVRLGVAYEGKGMHAEAARVFQMAERAAPGLLALISLQGHAFARAGNRREAVKRLDRLRTLARQQYVPAFLFASVHLGLGELDTAVSFLEKEYEARGWYLLLLRQSPLFDPLRGHPGFLRLLERMGFPALKDPAEADGS